MKLTGRLRQSEHEPRPYGSGPSEIAKRHLWRINWKAEGLPYCGVYAISPDNRWPTKIGVSIAPAKRVVELQTASWKRLDVAEYAYCESFKEARAVEKKAHEMLAADGAALHGEWFDIKPDKAMEVVRFAANTLNIGLRTDIPTERLEHFLYRFQYDLEETLARNEIPDNMVEVDFNT